MDVKPEIIDHGGNPSYEYVSTGPRTTERNFEDDVERFLGDAGWTTYRKERENGAANAGQEDYDRKLGLKVRSLIDFVKETQPDEWEKIEKLNGANTEVAFLKRVTSLLEPHQERDGLIATLRSGFSMAPNADFRLCYFKPSSSRNPQLEAKYRANRFEVVRQLRYGNRSDNELDAVDVVLFLNGIPVVTMELKNNLSGQRTAHAVEQYREDRSSKEILFKPNRRSIVHFAVDQETVEMTTWLQNGATEFMPFNRGNGMEGAGNPPNPEGYRTEYLYRDILAPDSLLDILQRYVRIEYYTEDEGAHRRGDMKRVIFPRFHQLEAVRTIVADAYRNGPGQRYLVQHSAGSGKSNSIAWLAHRLSTLHDADDTAVFDSVIVLTDRRNLDVQLSENIKAVDHKTGVVVPVEEKDGSAGLLTAINSGAKIITSTIQKFPYICQRTRVTGKRFAIIIDEAHSSQSGKANAKMRLALSGLSEEQVTREMDEAASEEDSEQTDAQDTLLQELAAQGPLPNLSFFAFTATPKASTLEVFGTRDERCKRDKDGALIPRPFHLYSMRQAIEEGFILDVLESYTIFETYFKLVKSIEADPRYRGSKANPALLGIARWNPSLIDKKASIIVEHFKNEVAGDLDCQAKAMVVASSRLMAYRYYRAIRRHVKDMGYRIPVLVAFSGTIQDGDEELTEAKLNGFPESQTAEEFDVGGYRILIAANKFQTGFDQPKLEAMYVDKVLTGVAAVQTLSRLNRVMPGKRTCVVDFVNDAETIQASFATYYGVTELDAVTDPNVVYDLKARLDGFDVYTSQEVCAVSDRWFESENPDEVLRRVESLLSPAVDRWKALAPEEAKLFKELLRKFLRTYAFITQMIALGDEDLHRFDAYAGFLIKKLYIPTSDSVDLRGKVELEYLRVEDRGTMSIPLDSSVLHNGAATPGIKPEEEKELLSELVHEMNDRFGTDFTEADKILKACTDKIMEDDEFVAQARNNSMTDMKAIFGEVMLRALMSITMESQDMAEEYSKHEKAYTEFLNDNLLPYVYRKCNEEEN